MKKWNHVQTVTYELEVTFRATGCYEPAITGGPSDNWAPAEGDDEREIVEVKIDGYTIKAKDRDSFWRALEDLIYDEELVDNVPEEGEDA